MTVRPLTGVLLFLVGALFAVWLMGDVSERHTMPHTARAASRGACVVASDVARDEDAYSESELRSLLANAASRITKRTNDRQAWAFMLERDDESRHYSLAVLAHIRAIRSWSLVERPIVVLINKKMKLASK